ncbi:peptidylprolyl isomerase [Phaeodactylibacter sp.]|uniref:peptidylprolyl isomerase n=1 Tax=Phaeodactylibacter sp. TaxID=1940289 RepID=UPI0025CBD5D6|nr:peptidylprolyl isomerase [Phaeodactylibacter sp.]MCI4648985.1 peptidylprolyl isomerase [Phaeodactylibacter sp.]MCI5092894.1 peptidylprolyl isomerase [Phaeodactylibacter sp.]
MKRTPLFYVVLAIILSSCARPVANFTLEGETQVLSPIVFDNQSENATAYEWDFGDGNTSERAEPSHTYRQSGNYTISLKAINEKGKARVTEKAISIAPPAICLVEIETIHGSMLVELYDATPQHQDNFVKLVQEGYYDGLLFHRVIENFMIQGGDPKSKDAPAGQALGSGGPGYTIPAEFVDSLVHIKGAIAAARTGDAVNPQKRSSGSQFYIVHGRNVTEQDLAQLEAQKGFRYTTRQKEAYLEHGGTPFLDRDYTVFGQVVEGFEVLDKLAAVPTDPRDRPKEDLKMKIRLIR